MNAVSLYLKFAGISIRGQMQYRASFIMLVMGNFIVTGIEFITLVVLFARFGSVRGWQLAEVAMFYGLINVSFALSEAIGRGFDHFAQLVITGEFDRVLLRPRATGLQVLAHDFQLMRAGRLLQGFAILIWASGNIGVEWDMARIALLTLSVLSGVMIFTGLLIMQAAICFWSTQSLEIMNSFTYGGVFATQWPLPILSRWFARVFIFLIPLAFVNYFPLLAVLGKPDVLGFPSWVQWASPFAGIIFLTLSFLVWRIGVRHYRSTGS